MKMTKLSSDGQRRREEMLVGLQKEVAWAARRRLRRRQSIAVVPLFLMVLGIWWAAGTERTEPPQDVASGNRAPSGSGSLDPFSIENVLVSNRQGIVDQYVVQTTEWVTPQPHYVTDDELLDLLAQAGKPSVLGRIGGRLTVIPLHHSQADSAN